MNVIDRQLIEIGRAVNDFANDNGGALTHDQLVEVVNGIKAKQSIAYVNIVTSNRTHDGATRMESIVFDTEAEARTNWSASKNDKSGKTIAVAQPVTVML